MALVTKYLGNIKGPKGDPGESPELINNLDYDGQPFTAALDATVGPQLKPILLSENDNINNIVTPGQYYINDASNMTGDFPPSMVENKQDGFFLEVYPFNNKLTVGQRITMRSIVDSDNANSVTFTRIIDIDGTTPIKVYPWQDFFLESGVKSENVSALREYVLEGYSTITNDSNDEIVEGTMVNNSVIDPALGGVNSTYPTTPIRKGNGMSFNWSTGSNEWLGGIKVPSGYYDDNTYVVLKAQEDIILTPTDKSQSVVSNAENGFLYKVTVNPIPSSYAEVININKTITVPVGGTEGIIFEENQIKDSDKYDILITILDKNMLVTGSTLILSDASFGSSENYGTGDGIPFSTGFWYADESHEDEADNDYRLSLYFSVYKNAGRSLEFYISKIIKYRN